MIDQDLNNRKSIKYYVKQYLEEIGTDLQNQRVIDIPAGNGATSAILKGMGAQVKPFDLFPEYFRVEGLVCQAADIVDHIPVLDGETDMLICQEGIEHF